MLARRCDRTIHLNLGISTKKCGFGQLQCSSNLPSFNPELGVLSGWKYRTIQTLHETIQRRREETSMTIHDIIHLMHASSLSATLFPNTFSILSTLIHQIRQSSLIHFPIRKFQRLRLIEIGVLHLMFAFRSQVQLQLYKRAVKIKVEESTRNK